ncbi:MAG: SusC/RagA family TonB-linked outer membrane protein [Saprospiraceae bacterium]|nr:SusC/RagA family TonB-linked outer membrane protein [Saprospiraceae bacterium]
MKKLFSLLIFSVVLVAGVSAQRTITGTLTDEDGLALIGANVLVEGTSVGTITDIDGKYSVNVPDGYDVIVYSYTGYNTQEITLGDSDVIDLVLTLNSQIIDEVVVVGYKTQSKPRSNVSTQLVSANTIESRPNASVVQTLQGQVAGLNITTSSGQPGANSTINLRGVSSINGNTEPLFIIDGTPVDEDNFRSINPNEIESVSVLKDAGATAIYGNRGANGVIVMKTKSGAYGQGLKFNYSTLISRSSVQPIDYDLMNAQESLLLEREFGTGRGSEISEDSIMNVAGTDWLDFFLRSPITQQHNFSVSTGSEYFNTFTNFGFMDQQGILKSSGLKRYNLRSNINGKSDNGKFRYGTKLSLNYSKNDEPSNIGSGAINRNFILGAYISVPYISVDEYVDGATLAASNWTFADTPIMLLDRLNTFTRVENEIKALGSVNVSYDILDNLTFTSVMGGDFADQNRLTAEGPTSFNAILFAETGNNTPGFQTQSNTRVFSYNWLNSLNYNFSLNNLHSFEVGLYSEYFRASYDFFTFTNNGLDPRTFSPGDGSGFVDDNAANDFFANTVGSNKLSAGLFSYFADFNYDYNDKYGFGATIRRDASYRFSESERWGTFYSFSGRWNIDQESFMENGPFDLLKLRGSWGVTGNQRIVDSGGFLNYFGGPDLTENFFATGAGYGGANSIFLSQIGNSTLKWETVTQSNIGIDFELFRSRLRGTFDVYTRTTDDLFQDRPVSAINATTSLRANIGSLKNSGFDVYVAYDILRSNNGLNLGLFLNTNYNKQEVIDLPTPDGTIQSGNVITREGSTLNEYYVYRYVGVNPANGNLLFLDADDNITENPSPDTDRVFTGKNIYPDYFGGFGFNADFRGFFLDVQFNYTIGVYRFDFDLADLLDPTSIGQFRMSNDLNRAWKTEGDITDIPSLTASNLALDGSSDRFLQSSDYVRLRFISLGYNFPTNMLADIGLSKLSMFVNAENMYTWTGWRGYDAESTNSTSRRYPSPRIISFGLEVGF